MLFNSFIDSAVLLQCYCQLPWLPSSLITQITDSDPYRTGTGTLIFGVTLIRTDRLRLRLEFSQVQTADSNAFRIQQSTRRRLLGEWSETQRLRLGTEH